MELTTILMIAGSAVAFIFFLRGFRQVDQTERGLIERWGKFVGFAEPGLHWILPVMYRMRRVDITEKMVASGTQDIITKDKLNASVDLVVYFQVQSDEESIKKSQYSVSDYETQIVSLARTTARNIIGKLSFTETNCEREKLNTQLEEHLKKEVQAWGLRIVRVELQEIDPPDIVQNAMNEVVTNEQKKLAATDFATAKETEADGERRAAVKKAQGEAEAVQVRAKADAEAVTLKAEAHAKAIELVNTAAEKYFKGNAQTLKRLESMVEATKANTKIIFTSDNRTLETLLAAAAGIKESTPQEPAAKPAT